MSRNTKIALGIVGLLVISCICVCAISFILLQSAGSFLEQSLVTDPAEVATIGAKIATYDPPAGYSQNFGMSLFGFDLVGLTAGEGKEETAPLIFMMQFPTWANMEEAQMEQQLQQAIGRQANSQDLQLEIADLNTVTIRDQEVTLTTREGANADEVSLRQVTGVFQGKGGPVLLMIMGNIDTWDQATVDAFIGSIR